MNRRGSDSTEAAVLEQRLDAGLAETFPASDPVAVHEDEPRPLAYPFQLPPLRFAHDALEPFFDTATMRLHHGKHHQTYVDGLNAAIQHTPALHDRSIEDILRRLGDVPEPIRNAVRNHGGGHANHQFLWKVIGPPGTRPQGELLAAIEADFGSFDNFKTRFTAAALTHFASGWAYLVMDPASGRLEVLALPNHDSVLTLGKAGLLICDVWEHAYYLKYQNRRAEFLNAFWSVVDWDVVAARLVAFRRGARVV